MDISNIYQQYYSKANIYSIDPKFIINFNNDNPTVNTTKNIIDYLNY